MECMYVYRQISIYTKFIIDISTFSVTTTSGLKAMISAQMSLMASSS